MERRSRDGPCVKVGAQIADTGAFDLLLLTLTPDQLQVGIVGIGPRFAGFRLSDGSANDKLWYLMDLDGTFTEFNAQQTTEDEILIETV